MYTQHYGENIGKKNFNNLGTYMMKGFGDLKVLGEAENRGSGTSKFCTGFDGAMWKKASDSTLTNTY